MLVQPKLDSHGGLKLPMEDKKEREYGRVIANVWDPLMKWHQCWVAFFGTRWPTNRMLMSNKPYVLRYLESSLRPFKPRRSKR